MARKMTCDRCGDEFPHVHPCDACNGTGNHIDGKFVYEGQCSDCRGTGKRSDPQEGKGFKLTITCDDGRPLVINLTVSDFYPNQPDLCGKCLFETVKEAFGKL